MQLPRRVVVTEVGTRDGFQMECNFIPTDQKVALVDALSASGLPRIEVTSFVHPRLVPQMRDAEEVMARIARRPGVTYTALAPNLKGAQRAVAAKVDEIGLVVSASESHNQENVRMSVEESLAQFPAVVELARSHGVRVAATVSTAFGCPFEGDVPEARVLDIVRRLFEMGMDGVGLADTTGMANPRQVYRLASLARERFPGREITLHFHNTRGMGLANVLAGLQAGIDRYDASLGGLGGCPFAPGATGNICTEDLVHMLHEMGIETGIDLDALLAAARQLQEIVGRELPGQVIKAGKRSQLHRRAS